MIYLLQVYYNSFITNKFHCSSDFQEAICSASFTPWAEEAPVGQHTAPLATVLTFFQS